MMRDALESGKWASPVKEKDLKHIDGAHESYLPDHHEKGTSLETANEISGILTGGEADKSKEQDIRKKKKRKGITI